MKTTKFPETDDSPLKVYMAPDPPEGTGEGEDGDDDDGVKE